MSLPRANVSRTRRGIEEYKNSVHGSGDGSSRTNITNDVLNGSNVSFNKNMHMHSS